MLRRPLQHSRCQLRHGSASERDPRWLRSWAPQILKKHKEAVPVECRFGDPVVNISGRPCLRGTSVEEGHGINKHTAGSLSGGVKGEGRETE